jgi:Pyridoxamine 5'-phosphate oxidase
MGDPRADRPQMSDYGVDTPEWEPLPWTWAAERLAAGRNFWFVTASATGRPHSLPVWGVWDDVEHRFGCSCAPSARKARNLRDNPHAVVTIDDTVECVSIEGTAAVLTDERRIVSWIERYLQKYQPLEPNLDADFLRANLIIEFTAQRAFGVIERADEFSTRATRWTFP